MERRHTEALAQVVLRDPALSFELLRTCNGALVRASQVTGNGPVLTVRRAISLLGLDGVRRCALVLRDWPGPLDAQGAADLQRMLAQARRAARVAQALRPAGYDAEIVGLVTLLQNLGRLLAHYHHPDETRQMRRLMLPVPGDGAQQDAEPGLDETAAAHAVFGCDLESMALAVARWWGMDDSVLAMSRRLPAGEPVRRPQTDEAMLRTVASAAIEAVDAPGSIEAVAERFSRALDTPVRDLVTALQDALAAPAETAEAV
jgi:HD-like signal output (HDOD) protein